LELFRLGISDATDLLADGAISSKDILDSVFSRIEAVDDRVRAFLSLTRDRAYDRMEDLKISEKKGLLSGIPLAIKDNLCIKGIKTTCASKILEGFVPPYESSVTERLLESGYILIGKTNLDEFAMGSSTENSGYFVTHNPWDLERVPGGSSGGLLQRWRQTSAWVPSAPIPVAP